MIDMYEDVFRDDEEDRAIYDHFLPDDDPEKDTKFRADTREALHRKWRTLQLSDHKPLWGEIATDYADHYLQQFAGEK